MAKASVGPTALAKMRKTFENDILTSDIAVTRKCDLSNTPVGEPYTPGVFWDMCKEAGPADRLYSWNWETSAVGTRLCTIPGNILTPEMHAHISREGSITDEDILMGGTNSYTACHIDTLPIPVRITVLFGAKLVFAMPFDSSTHGMPLVAQKGQMVRSATHFRALQTLAVSRGGFAEELRPGEYVAIPSMWWHAAFNLRPTVSVNNSFVLAEDATLILYNIALLGTARRTDERLAHMRSMTLGPGFQWVLRDASEAIFPGAGIQVDAVGRVLASDSDAPSLGADTRSAAEVAKRGAWLSFLSAALEIMMENAEGTGQGTGKRGKRSDLQVLGFNGKNRDMLLRWAKDRHGSTGSAKLQRRLAAEAPQREPMKASLAKSKKRARGGGSKQ